jgi:hypothetical protein
LRRLSRIRSVSSENASVSSASASVITARRRPSSQSRWSVSAAKSAKNGRSDTRCRSVA